MLERLKQDITLKLKNAEYFKGNDLPDVEFSVAPAHTGADISLVWAMAAAKKMRKNPMEIAKAACQVLREVTDVKDATALAPGFINLTLEDDFIISTASDRRIKTPQAEGKKHSILIEFVSANPTGPLHVASGRGASLGDSLVKIHRALGYSCDSEYYVNDAGNQADFKSPQRRQRTPGKRVSRFLFNRFSQTNPS